MLYVIFLCLEGGASSFVIMKIAIISDTHDNLANIKKIVNWLNKEKINLLLHCGDINSQDAINEIDNNFNGEAKFVRGNADISINELKEIGELEIKNKKIVFTHFSNKAHSLAESGKYNLVFYGHTHKPWEEKVGDCRLVNPGEAAGQYNKATFAVYNIVSDKLELKIIERLETQ